MTVPLPIGPGTLAGELAEVTRKIARGIDRLARVTDDELAIATAPKTEVWRDDMVTLYRYAPVVETPLPIPVLIVYALIGRYPMIDLEADRSFVRKLLAEGLDVYVVDWGLPRRAQRWLTIDDYVSGYLDDCVDAIRERSGMARINLLGICQGGVFSLCYAALMPEKVQNLILTVTPIDFHADRACPTRGAGYMNLWTRAATSDDVDLLVDAYGGMPGPMVGFAFLMMNPVGNVTKYTTDLVGILDDERKLMNFLRMEKWIADRPDHPGEVLRQWLKDFYQGNRLVRGELDLDGKRVDLARVTMPVLNVYATGDTIVPPSCTRGLAERFGSRDYRELAVPGGHIGTFVGAKAQAMLAPSIAEWLKARMGRQTNRGQSQNGGADSDPRRRR